MSRFAWIVWLGLIGCWSVFAQGPAKAGVVLRVPVLQLDPPLEANAFSATVNGAQAKVLGAKGPASELIVLVVLDLTGEINLIDTARGVLAQVLPESQPNVWYAVLKSQDALEVLVDPTADREKVVAAIQNYGATGKAALLDTIEPSMRLADGMLRKSAARVAVLYVTDSNITNYREDFTNPVINATDAGDLSRKFPGALIREKIEKLTGSIAAYQAPFFFVHLSYFSDPYNEAYQRGLLQLATESGGSGVFCRSPGEIPPAVERVLAAVASHWSVSVQLPAELKARTVSVLVSNQERSTPGHTRFVLRK
ncbi:hypothetical protein F183_A49180 [Bryobacterales bacterium F-183]|nr:hypothetical protein F183_A49180 [Bryobacterales bacterium F-183]